jgi:hypothetical protein
MKTLILLSFCAASASLIACSSTSDDTVMPSQSLQAPQSDTSPATPESGSGAPPPILPDSSTQPAPGQPPPANPDQPLP